MRWKGLQPLELAVANMAQGLCNPFFGKVASVVRCRSAWHVEGQCQRNAHKQGGAAPEG